MDKYYEAMLARDPRFDGKFFVAVKTTGIYCRPICPAKPKRQNVEFFRTYLEAERAGYRPCLRCRPESAPHSPAWIGKSAVVRRALKKLHDHHPVQFNEDRFADLFGISARHLRRLFIDEIGKTPKQIASDTRLNLARKLIVETKLPIAQIAFGSGFNSIRRFNGAFKDRFKKQPSQIRRTPIGVDKGVKISLAYRPPFNFAGLLASYRAHRVGDLEWFDDQSMHRVVAFNRQVGQISITDEPSRSRLLVTIEFPDTAMIHAIASRVRTLFDLDSDPVVVANALESDAPMARLLKKHAGIRLPSGWDPFEVAIGVILGQLVSVERGRSMVHDLINMLGEPSGLYRDGRPIKLFPTPQRLASADLTALKTTTMRKRSLAAFAEAINRQQLSLEPTQDVERFVEKVRALPGIGPWTASYMALKVLRHTDAFPASDLILARALQIHSPQIVEAMSPWRGYVAALMWREYAHTLKKPRGVNHEPGTMADEN